MRSILFINEVVFDVETFKTNCFLKFGSLTEKSITKNIYILVASSITENAGVENLPHGHMTASGDLLDAPSMLAKKAPIWCTDSKEMVSIAKIYDVFASIVNLTNNHKFCFPCSEQECTMYSTLNTDDRAASFTTGSRPSCDKGLPEGWYRFLRPAGNRMASACVPTKRCGTAVTGWLSSPHPKMTEGIVSGTVCFHWKSNCCKVTQEIQVRNCGRFFVYKLTKTKQCPMRFCAETKVNSSSSSCILCVSQ